MNNGLMPTGRSTYSMHDAHVLQVSTMSVQADRWSEIFLISRFELRFFLTRKLEFHVNLTIGFMTGRWWFKYLEEFELFCQFPPT